MTLSGDFSRSANPGNLAIAKRLNDFLQVPAPADLVFTQDGTGIYLSFYWREAEVYGLTSAQMVGRTMVEAQSDFAPVAIASYLKRIQQVLEFSIAEQFRYPFCCDGQYLVFDLTVSPLLLPNHPPTTATIVGQFLHHCSEEQAIQLAEISPHCTPIQRERHSSRYQKPLIQVAWAIRRTLDLHTIWQQTADGLGETLGVSRCLVCSYLPHSPTVTVVAEYCQPGLSSRLGLELDAAVQPDLRQALDTLKPVRAITLKDPEAGELSLLVLATCHKDEPNGLIILHQLDASWVWNDIEVGLIQELADQVGTGIAHAHVFAESLNLTADLQRANADLLKQHEELEEARQQAEEASRLKSEFLANTSHELRTPLNGMLGFLKLIMDGMVDDPAEQEEFIREAYRSAYLLLQIINDILDIAKIEAGKMQLELNPVKLDDVLTDVENFARTQAQQKRLAFKIRYPTTRDPVVVLGNYQRLLQVMLNLVNNAIKFTHEGSITITAVILPKASGEKAGIAKISVADTGIGVSLDKQDKLFQSFSQIDGSRTRQYGGTGLGLAISQKLVEAMNGIVNFYSLGDGLGSTVTFTVPLYQDPVLIASQPEEEPDEEEDEGEEEGEDVELSL